MATVIGRGILNLRWSYNNVEKDPEIDKYRTLYQKQHLKEDDLAALAGLSTSTVKAMMGGKTRRPQHLTYAKLAAAMHHEYVLQPISNGKIDYDAEISLAKEERKSYRALIVARRERKAKKARKKPAS